MNNLVRLLHNAVASSESLSDHIDKVVKKLYENQPFLEEYTLKEEEMVSTKDIRSFMQRLRHYRLPRIEAIMYLDGNERICVDFKMDVQDLWSAKKWWNSKAKSFIRSNLNSGINLFELFYVYHEIYSKFYFWLKSRQSSIHKEDLDAVELIMNNAVSNEFLGHKI
ncbi:MAG: hypothetical protein F6K00_15855 [Leptolyngbya sp. SIOISBB]|nr:hypothetical protein [Leptolyngbya sp. SIOISBB]